MSRLSFLLLEDSVLDAELIQAMLASGGIDCKLIYAKTRDEFETALKQGGFDVILADYSLPGFDGITALEIAQQLCVDVPFIFVTASMGEEVAIETLKKGATDYVLKQRLERLVPAIERALREAKERCARKQVEVELRQQKEELEKANKIKDEFLAVLSHELRSPLNAILGWSKILRSRKLDETNFNRALETIERNAKLQTQLIEDLLDVSRIIRGKLTLRRQPTNLISAIQAAIDTMRLASQAKAIDLRFEILENGQKTDVESSNSQVYTINSTDSSKLYLESSVELNGSVKPQPSKYQVLGDPNRLQQIIWNLLSNAIKFTPQGGRVEVQLDEMAKDTNDICYAKITVKDTGIGIDCQFLPHVFETFRQADGSTTRKYGGLGLGLAIVQQLVQLHGGSVSAESLGEGQGATFTVKLPLIEQKYRQANTIQASPNNFYSPARPLAGVRILVVDDDADSRSFLVFALSEFGAKATAVSSAARALKVLPSLQADILISDIGMPEQDGYNFIRQVRKLPPTLGGKIPAIALTAYAGDKDREEAIAAGFQKHLPKPVTPDELLDAVMDLAIN